MTEIEAKRAREEAANEAMQEVEKENGCCECGEAGHGCNDCPTFGGEG